MGVQVSVSNGGSVADVTNNFDAMDKLLDFLTGVTAGSPILPVIERWTINKDDTTTVPGERHVYLEGPGLSGTDAIFVVIRVFNDIPNSVFSWEILGATGFDNGAAFDAQPGITTVKSFLTLSNSVTTPFWFVANGRRFFCSFKVSVAYPSCIGGWYLPYATPTEFPYPMYNGGNAFLSTTPVTTTNFTVGNFYDGPVGTVAQGAAVAQLRHRDGTWLRAGSYNSSTSGTRPTSLSANVECFTAMYDDVRDSGDQPNKDTIENNDGSYPLIPIVLYSDENGGNIYGELDGLFWTPASGNSAESTITVGGDTYLVVQNMYRSAEVNMAILLA